MTVKTVGLDLAKDVFQVHGISETGRKIFNKKIKRAKLLPFFEALPRCLVGMEACGSLVAGNDPSGASTNTPVIFHCWNNLNRLQKPF